MLKFLLVLNIKETYLVSNTKHYLSFSHYFNIKLISIYVNLMNISNISACIYVYVYVVVRVCVWCMVCKSPNIILKHFVQDILKFLYPIFSLNVIKLFLFLFNVKSIILHK